MTKEELLKVFSVYLPYNVELYHLSHFKSNRIIKYWGLKNCSDYPISEYCDGTRYGRTFQEVKPILYDLSYLTKEIEHEGVWINIQKQMRHLDFEWLIGNPKLASKLDQEDYEILLKHHFNIFNLPEDQFINKATLNK